MKTQSTFLHGILIGYVVSSVNDLHVMLFDTPSSNSLSG